MAVASLYLEQEFIKFAFTAEAQGTRPTAWTVKLHSADPGDTSANEITGSGYVAQSATWTRTTNSVANTAAITFPTVTTTGYTVSHVSVFDQLGNSLYHGPLALAKTLAVGEAISFAIGQLILNVT